jgi:hypothetical protein
VISAYYNEFDPKAAEKLVRSSDQGASIDANATQEAMTMRVKGYGNSIQSQTATMFIDACIDCMGDKE